MYTDVYTIYTCMYICVCIYMYTHTYIGFISLIMKSPCFKSSFPFFNFGYGSVSCRTFLCSFYFDELKRSESDVTVSEPSLRL